MTPEARVNMSARVSELKFKTVFKAPPGDELSHHSAGFAKIMCCSVFISGLSPDFILDPWPAHGRPIYGGFFKIT